MSDTEKNIKKAADTYLQALVAAVANNEKALAMALVQKALSGDMQALKEINDRVLGSGKDKDAGTQTPVIPISDERIQEILEARAARKATAGTAPRVSTNPGAVPAESGAGQADSASGAVAPTKGT